MSNAKNSAPINKNIKATNKKLNIKNKTA